MKSTGIVRRIDDLGRIVLPKELRRTMEIGDNDSLEIFVDGNKIIIIKYQVGCLFCGNIENVEYHHFNKPICKACVNTIIDNHV